MFAGWLAEHWNDVRDVALTHATQTNEAARCALHLPVLGGIEGPIALLEVRLDVRSSADVEWLDALVWPEHDDRRGRLRAAAEIAARTPPLLVSGDLNEQSAALAASAPSDATLVVFHTAVLMYLDDAGREAFVRQVGELPGHWLSVEGRSVVPGIRVRDDVPNDGSDLVLAVDGVQRAWAHPHGRALTWAPNP
ncbi:DUF2332 family protein [Agromyces laixinhei]|uniref:DUF2332 family protein n=1 Tax=Agromyces laixinhei TaxID=2585717 RepID=UPI0018DBDC44